MRKISIAFVLMLLLFVSLNGCSSKRKDTKMSVRVLILPKFEVEELSGDFPGEAQYFFEEYLSGGDVFDIDGCPEATKLYYKNGVAMCVVGQDQGGRKRSPRGKIPWEIDHA
ncbi:MAG: hypothetical protein K6A77_03955 [Clostridiales bacterium]|nr:hypothetical protein [Clostridiales bacterium]